MPKRVGKEPEDNKSPFTPDTKGPLYDQYDPNATGKTLEDLLAKTEAEQDNAISLDDINSAAPESNVEPQRDMALHTKEFYEKQTAFSPAIEYPEGREQAEVKRTAAPAKTIDIENLDESMIMDMPEIKASSFKVIDVLSPKPKDKTIRFRWANYKNFVAGNLGKYLAIGFQPASIDDIDQSKTPIDPSMIDGTQIKYYDVVLLKINVIRLMELYKTNILKSVNKLVKAKEKGLAEATRQFQNDVSASPGASAAYNHYKQVLHKEPVEFYAAE